MILAIDTGNTNIVLGCIENRKICAVARMATDVNKTDYEYAVGMKNVLAFAGFQPESFEGAILSNVVWPLTSTLGRAVQLRTGLDTLVVGKGLKPGLDIRLDDPGQIGADLVVGAVAALHLHRPPLIVIDMGTATTISAVDAQGRFAGGAIVPGLRLSMESLSGNTSQLPRVSLDAPAKCIGTNTVACMQSGAIYGSAALLDGMIERMETELGAPAAVIATGGLAGCVTPFCRREIRYEPDLLLIGLAVLWEKSIKTNAPEQKSLFRRILCSLFPRGSASFRHDHRGRDADVLRQIGHLAEDALRGQTAVGDHGGLLCKTVARERRGGLADGLAGFHQYLCAGKLQRYVQIPGFIRIDMQRRVPVGETGAERCGNGAEARDAGYHLRGVSPAAQLVKHVVRRGADRNIAEIHHGDA